MCVCVCEVVILPLVLSLMRVLRGGGNGSESVWFGLCARAQLWYTARLRAPSHDSCNPRERHRLERALVAEPQAQRLV